MSKNLCLLPRDAGFFSVFNFYIGALCSDSSIRSYPYFNKQAFLAYNNGENKHFAYWTENENSWFDFFKPVKFDDNDTNHIDGNYKTFPIHVGLEAAEEFRVPSITKKLFKDSSFLEWRHKTNAVYKKYIDMHDDILNRIDNHWNANYNENDIIIGVHYRHPSHFVESGEILLKDYFDKIDAIMIDKPEAKIFLASDNNFGIYAFIEKYGNKTSYIKNIDRISMNDFLEWAFMLSKCRVDNVGLFNGKGFELQHQMVSNNNLNTTKKMTQDLLTEVACLSKCDYLVHTISNVALAISYMNTNIKLKTLT
jgi:hypothetical protein